MSVFIIKKGVTDYYERISMKTAHFMKHVLFDMKEIGIKVIQKHLKIANFI